MLVCEYCSKECKNLKNHIKYCKLNPNRVLSPFERANWQKERTKSNQHIKGTAVPLSAESKEKIRESKKAYWTLERRVEYSTKMKKIMQQAVVDNPESYSYKNFCGRSKKTLYKEQWLHSSWELDVAKWFDKNSIKWTRKVPGFKYMWDNVEKTYFPDFYLPELDIYIEVKGYQIDQDTAKWQSVPGLVVLKEKEIKQIQKDEFTLVA